MGSFTSGRDVQVDLDLSDLFKDAFHFNKLIRRVFMLIKILIIFIIVIDK